MVTRALRPPREMIALEQAGHLRHRPAGIDGDDGGKAKAPDLLWPRAAVPRVDGAIIRTTGRTVELAEAALATRRHRQPARRLDERREPARPVWRGGGSVRTRDERGECRQCTGGEHGNRQPARRNT